ncbi:DNA polymerase III subunit delta [Lentilitoribacter sp. EG35]|uniref:DNA polymerase III subunit delta n=1 Tax=Lentilitoribacter sp. EG35 TaxID=3234192 RepID=UPI00345F53A3
MAQIKAHEFDGLIKRTGIPYRAFLIYGPDNGLVSERARELSKKIDVDLADDFATIRLESSEISSDPGRLADEIGSIGLFGGDRLIWVKNAGGDKKLPAIISGVLEEITESVTLIIEAGDLKKSSPLRKMIEKAPPALAIPCYADDGRSLQALIDQELGAANLRIENDARQLLLSFLGGDRLASRGELQKLTLYCQEQKNITAEDVTNAIGDASSISVDETVDAILTGNINELDKSFSKIIISKTPIFLVLRSCLAQLQQIDIMRSEIEVNKKQAGQVMSEMGRYIHFKRKPAFEKALRKWTCSKLSKEMDRLSNTILETRKNAALEESIARQALMRVCLLSR